MSGSFAVGLRSPAYHAAALQNMASTTGGSYVEASSPADLRPLLVKLGNRLSSEYLVNYTSCQNPSTKVVVAVSVKGFPGAVRTAYKTPALHIVPAAAVQAVCGQQRRSSPSTSCSCVAILFALLIGFAIIIGDVDEARAARRARRRVRFRTAGARHAEPAAEKRPNLHLAGDRARLAVGLVGPARRRRSSSPTSRRPRFSSSCSPAFVTILAGPHSRACSRGRRGRHRGLHARSSRVRSCSIACRRKRRAFAEQLPDNLEVLASALRAGPQPRGCTRRS